MNAPSGLVHFLRGVGFDEPERMAEAVAVYRNNTNENDPSEWLAIAPNSPGDGPALIIGGETITSGEVECVERLEWINRERGFQ